MTQPSDTEGSQREGLLSVLRRDPAWLHLGIEIVAPTDEPLHLKMRVQDYMLNAFGIMHGGFIFTLGDSCFALTTRTSGRMAVSRQADISFIAPVIPGATLIAHGSEVTRFGRNCIVDVKIHDEAGRHIAEMRVHGVDYPKEA
jgi:acyl-CoA thioesterase